MLSDNESLAEVHFVFCSQWSTFYLCQFLLLVYSHDYTASDADTNLLNPLIIKDRGLYILIGYRGNNFGTIPKTTRVAIPDVL